MAIIGPADLPAVLKVPSDPMKAYVLAQLGHGVVDVELTEQQLEIVLRVTGDFICGYFPREQRYSWFQTVPLQNTYPMPADAYWVEEVAWDPVTTNINDIFSAESYLFCAGPELRILAADGSLQELGGWQKNWKAKTPYGNKKLKIKHHDNKRLMPKLRVEYDGGVVQATCNHVLAVAGQEKWGLGHRWRELRELTPGQQLIGVGESRPAVVSVDGYESAVAIGVRAQGAGCYYGCVEGEPILLH